MSRLGKAHSEIVQKYRNYLRDAAVTACKLRMEIEQLRRENTALKAAVMHKPVVEGTYGTVQ